MENGVQKLNETLTPGPTEEAVQDDPQNDPGFVEQLKEKEEVNVDQKRNVIDSQPEKQPIFKESRRLPSFGRTQGFDYLRLESPDPVLISGPSEEVPAAAPPYEESSTAGVFGGTSTTSHYREPPPQYPWQQSGATQVIPVNCGRGGSWTTQTYPINDRVRNIVILNGEQPRRNEDCDNVCLWCFCHCCFICCSLLCSK